jgi:hypothetical protein
MSREVTLEEFLEAWKECEEVAEGNLRKSLISLLSAVTRHWRLLLFAKFSLFEF